MYPCRPLPVDDPLPVTLTIEAQYDWCIWWSWVESFLSFYQSIQVVGFFKASLSCIVPY